MDAAAVVIEHAGAAEEPAAIPQPAQRHALGRAFVQQAVEFRVFEWRAQAAADNQQVELFQCVDGQFRGHQFQPQVAQYPVAVQRQRGKTEAVGAQQVGRYQHVHGHGKTGHGKVLEQNEIDAVGRLRVTGGGLEPQHVAGAGLLAELAWGGHSGLRFLAGRVSVAAGCGKDNRPGGHGVFDVVCRQLGLGAGCKSE